MKKSREDLLKEIMESSASSITELLEKDISPEVHRLLSGWASCSCGEIFIQNMKYLTDEKGMDYNTAIARAVAGVSSAYLIYGFFLKTQLDRKELESMLGD